MIEATIDYFNARLDLLGYFQKTFGLCEKTVENGRPAPRYYCGSGEWKEVSNYDLYQGTAYWRKVGPYTATESDLESFISNKRLVRFSAPLRLVVCIPKDKLGSDSAYSGELLGVSILKKLTTKAYDLKTVLNAKRVTVNINTIETDPRVILDAEYSQTVDVRYEYQLLAIDLVVDVDANEDCLLGDCYDYTDGCDFYLKLVSMKDRLSCILPTIDFSTSAAQQSLTEQQETDLTAYLCTNTIVNENYFSAGSTSLTYTVSVNSAGSYTAEVLSNVSAVTYTKNAAPVTLPFTLEAGDTFQIDITQTDGGQPSTVTISGTF